MTDPQKVHIISSSIRLDRPEAGNLADEMLSIMGPDSDLLTAAKAYEVLKKHEQRRQPKNGRTR